ncbi:MAG: oligosaccharide flippase family protein [Candidatus Hydrothermales bacterium]
MEAIVKKILFNSLVIGTLWTTVGHIVQSFFYFLFLSFSGKVIGSEGVGILGVFYSFYNFTSFLLGSGFRDYLSRKIVELKSKGENEKIKDLIDESFTYTLFVFFLSLLFFLILKNFLLEKFFNNNSFILFSAFLVHLFSVFSSIGLGFLIGKKLFYAFAFVHTLKGLIFLFFGFFYFIKRVSSTNLFVTVYILSEFSNFFFFLVYLIYLKKSLTFKINLNFLKEGILSMGFSNTIIQSYFGYPILLLKLKNVPDDLVGNFTAGISVFQAVKLLFNSYFVPVYPHISSFYYEGKKKKFFKTIIFSSILIFISLLFFTLFIISIGKSILYLFFPKHKFKFYTSEFLLLSVSLLFYLFSRFFSRVFFAIQKENIVFINFLLWLLVLTLPFLLLNFKNKIISLLILNSFATFVNALIFTVIFIKIFSPKGSIPLKEEKIRNEDIC